MTRSTILTIIVSFVVSLFCVAQAQGALYTLIDDNSTVQIQDSSSGISSWVVDGTDNLFQQWFWYRIGGAGGESSVDTLGAPVVDDDDGDGILGLTYANGTISVELDFTLGGGQVGSGVADLGEVITINNTTSETLVLHFFQYVDFDLGSDASDDWVQVVNPWVVQQTDGQANISETVVTPDAILHEVGIKPATLNRLLDTLPTTLDGSSGLLGPANVTWAFQWDFTLNPAGEQDSSFVISKNKRIVIPEPATLFVMLAAGLPMLLRNRRRRG